MREESDEDGETEKNLDISELSNIMNTSDDTLQIIESNQERIDFLVYLFGA